MYVVCSPQLLAIYASSSLSLSRGLLLLSVEPWRGAALTSKQSATVFSCKPTVCISWSHFIGSIFRHRNPQGARPILQTSTCHPKTSLATGQKFAEI